MRYLVFIFFFLALGCGYAPHKDPPLHEEAVATVALQHASQEADLMHGFVAVVTCCGSMKPLIQDGDLLVIVKVPFDDQLLGKVVNYHPKWANGGTVSHRLVSGNATNGFIASGDNNPHSETQERVTKAIFNGEVVSIYRTKQ